MAYIKSHSNYVLKSKHKSLDSGMIFERDYTTIGGVDSFSKGQTPIYRSGNFLITVNTEKTIAKQHAHNKWESNENGDVWKYSNVENIAEISDSDDTKIVLKTDYYDLADFAYYGSCSELIKGSVNDIIKRFPSELYFTNNTDILVNYYYIENPGNIDIWSQHINETNIKNPLKFLSINHKYWDNYEVILGDGEAKNIKNITVSVPTTKPDNVCSWMQIQIQQDGGEGITIFAAKFPQTPTQTYLFTLVNKRYHIRPKEKFLNEFFASLDNFEKILLNPKTEPKYKASFDIYREDEEKGLSHEITDFIFPIGNGGYNVGSDANSFNAYIGGLLSASEFYDTKFCDNLYRMMTHESIKNFDYSYNKNAETTEEWQNGSEKISKLIRLFGREFDEIKSYIDGITSYNYVSYNDINNVPDYFLTDILETDGWDVVNIFPLEYKEDECGKIFKQDISSKIKPFSNRLNQPLGYFNDCPNSGGVCKVYSNVPSSSITETHRVINGHLRNKIQKYSDNKEYEYKTINSLFLKRLKLNSRDILRHKGTIQGLEMIFGLFGLKSNRFVKENEDFDYSVEEYTSFTNGIDDPFWGCKGKNRIEWYNSTKSIQYNETDETPYRGLPVAYRNLYYSVTKVGVNYVLGGLIDNIKEVIDYNIDTYELKYYDDKNNKIGFGETPVLAYRYRRLYPSFNQYDAIDGDLYYQMNGGWLENSVSFDNNNNFISGNVYTETVNTLKVVEKIEDLGNIPSSDLENGDIVYVNDLSGRYLFINGYLYQVEIDAKNHKYINVQVDSGTVTIGGVVFVNDLYTFTPYGLCKDEQMKGTYKYYDLNTISNDATLKIYLVEENGINKNTIIVQNALEHVEYFINIPNTNQHYTENGYVSDILDDETHKTHYFKILNSDYAYLYDGDLTNSGLGWLQLPDYHDDFYKINTLKNYFKGNNPHSGKLKYDGGFGYMNYFSNLFNYSLNNDLFDSRPFRDQYYTEIDNISRIGFKNLIDDECNKTYHYWVDDKVHYFGNWFTNGDTTTPSAVWDAKDSDDNPKDRQLDDENKHEVKLESGETKYTKDTTEFIFNMNNYNSWYDYNSYVNGITDVVPRITAQTVDNVCTGATVDGSTNQIVNTKLFKISINLLSTDETSDLYKSELKFYQSVVLPYVTQMIPSTTILKVEYKTNCHININL